MYVHFDLYCNGETQIRIHPRLRHEIREWRSAGLVTRAELTYHYGNRHDESLYACVDLPQVEKTSRRGLILPLEARRRIPQLIVQFVKGLCIENSIKWNVIDYEEEIRFYKERAEKRGESYCGGADIDEILRYGAVATEVAFEVLFKLEMQPNAWRDDLELDKFMISRLQHELGPRNKWMPDAFHIVCNTLGLVKHHEYYMLVLSGGHLAVLEYINWLLGRSVRA